MNAHLTKFTLTVIFRGLMFLFGGVLTWAGIPKEEQELGMQEIAQMVLGFVLMALPVVWATLQQRWALMQLPPKVSLIRPEQPKQFNSSGHLLLVLGVLVLSQGCALPERGGISPEDQLRWAERAVTSVETAILFAQASGAISPEQAQRLDQAGAAMHSAYSALLNAYVDGDFDTAHKEFNRLLREHLERVKAEGVKIEQTPTGEITYDGDSRVSSGPRRARSHQRLACV